MISEEYKFPLFDCAYEYESESGQKKLGLYEVDPKTKSLLVEVGENQQTYRVYPLELLDMSFSCADFEDSLHLRKLPNLMLKMKEDFVQHVSIDRPKLPIFLANILHYMKNHIVFQDGMSGMYGIEKILTDDGEYFIRPHDFPTRKYLQENEHIKSSIALFKNITETYFSVHNHLHGVINFRCALADCFAKTIANSRGQQGKAKFCMANISPFIASQLFSFLEDKFRQNEISFKPTAIDSIQERKDIMYHRDLMTQGIIVSKLFITKTSRYFDHSESVVVSVPFTEFLIGFLPDHYYYYPEKIDIRRSSTPPLDSTRFDYIPFERPNLMFSYDALTERLQCSFRLEQKFHAQIKMEPTLKSSLAMHGSLRGLTFLDSIYKWAVVEYNSDRFREKVGKKKFGSGYFVAWGIPHYLFITFSDIQRFSNDKAYREDSGFCIPYDPINLNRESLSVEFLTETDKDVHKEMVETFFWSKNVDAKKNNITNSNNCHSSVKKRLYSSSDFNITPPNLIKRERNSFNKKENFVNLHDNFQRFIDNLALFRKETISNISQNEIPGNSSNDEIVSPDTSIESSFEIRNRHAIIAKIDKSVDYLKDNLILAWKNRDSDMLDIDETSIITIFDSVFGSYSLKDIKDVLLNVFPRLKESINEEFLIDLRTVGQIVLHIKDFVKICF